MLPGLNHWCDCDVSEIGFRYILYFVLRERALMYFKLPLMTTKAKFGSKIGLIAATVGSAVGLGNIWRFPAEAQNNGGAAFLLLYIICVFLLGLPLMLAEFSLGRGTSSDAVGCFRQLRPGSRWWLTGLLGIVASYCILCFYMVVAGWTFEYFWQSITGGLYSDIHSTHESLQTMSGSFTAKMQDYVADDWHPLINTFIMIAINILVLIGGVQKGIERISTWLMPLLFLLLLTFCGVALSFPAAKEGLEFFFRPDFSKVTASSVINALGQAFFSLSLGMGCLITYGSYFPHSTKLCSTAVTVALLDMLVAVMMGVIIFPSVFSFGLTDANLEGTTLVFVTLPEVFAQMPGTRIWSILFFLLLVVAALTSTISMAEVSISFLQDRFSMGRRKATLIVTLPLFLLSSLCSLSFGSLKGWTIAGDNIFGFLDNLTTDYLLPVGGLLICLFVGWVAPAGYFRKELTPSLGREKGIYRLVDFLVRWVAPLLILAILFGGIWNK